VADEKHLVSSIPFLEQPGSDGSRAICREGASSNLRYDFNHIETVAMGVAPKPILAQDGKTPEIPTADNGHGARQTRADDLGGSRSDIERSLGSADVIVDHGRGRDE
jgi:hypothetical protein